MSDKDFAGARAALTGVLDLAKPIMAALQNAEAVLGAIPEAEKHRRALAAEVADYKAELDKLRTAVTKQQDKLKAVMAEVGVAERDADVRINEALTLEKSQLAAAKLSVAQDISALNTARAKSQAESEAAIVAAQAASAEAVGVLAAKEKALEADVAALEKKLAALRANAAKFAAALVAE